jgi:Domain of unknown function (DUF4304)
MMDKKEFKKAISGVLKREGFSNKGQSFFKSGADCIVVLNLQKSDYEDKYYVNLGFWLKEAGEVIFPADNHCHIQARLISLFPEYAHAIESGCRLDANLSDFSVFIEFLKNSVVPFCNECLTIGSLKEKIEHGVFGNALIMKTAKDILKLS